MDKNVYIRIYLLIICVIVLSVACTQKTLPVITSRQTELPKKEIASNIITPDLALGKTIFINHCGKCHDLPLPEQYTAKRWVGILSHMIPRARLDTVQGVHVSAFLKDNAAKQN